MSFMDRQEFEPRALWPEFRSLDTTAVQFIKKSFEAILMLRDAKDLKESKKKKRKREGALTKFLSGCRDCCIPN